MNAIKSKTLTAEDIMKTPEMADFHETALFLQKNKGKILFSRKFLVAVKSMVAQRVPQMYETNPSMPLTEVVTAILKGLDKRTDGDMLIKITKWIVDEWQSVTNSDRTQKQVFQAV